MLEECDITQAGGKQRGIELGFKNVREHLGSAVV